MESLQPSIFWLKSKEGEEQSEIGFSWAWVLLKSNKHSRSWQGFKQKNLRTRTASQTVRFDTFLDISSFALDFIFSIVLHSIARLYFLKKCTLLNCSEPTAWSQLNIKRSFKYNLYKYVLGWNPNLCSEVLICENKWLHSRKDTFQDKKSHVVEP